MPRPKDTTPAVTAKGERYIVARLGENQWAVLEIQKPDDKHDRAYYGTLLTKRTGAEAETVADVLRAAYGKK